VGGVLAGLILVISPHGWLLGFAPLPPLFFGVLVEMIVTYVGLVQVLKRRFLRGEWLASPLGQREYADYWAYQITPMLIRSSTTSANGNSCGLAANGINGTTSIILNPPCSWSSPFEAVLS
jgi:hypothetical protein